MSRPWHSAGWRPERRRKRRNEPHVCVTMYSAPNPLRNYVSFMQSQHWGNFINSNLQMALVALFHYLFDSSEQHATMTTMANHRNGNDIKYAFNSIPTDKQNYVPLSRCNAFEYIIQVEVRVQLQSPDPGSCPSIV